MTAAQKKVAANFKKAIAYRKQYGCTLKEAFEKVYGKKTTTTKKSASKKKTIGQSNIPKATTKLAERLWDVRNKNFQDEFQLSIIDLMDSGKYLGYSYHHTRAAILSIVKEIITFNMENY